MLDGAANNFSIIIGPCVPIASGNERTAFEKSHGLLLFLKCRTIALSRDWGMCGNGEGSVGGKLRPTWKSAERLCYWWGIAQAM
jgi:hypothetical protein